MIRPWSKPSVSFLGVSAAGFSRVGVVGFCSDPGVMHSVRKGLGEQLGTVLFPKLDEL